MRKIIQLIGIFSICLIGNCPHIWAQSITQSYYSRDSGISIQVYDNGDTISFLVPEREEAIWAEVPKSNAIMTDATERQDFKAKFKGDLEQYIKQHLVYPAKARQEKIQGDVIVSFILRVNGQVGTVEVLKGVHPLLDSEALRIVKSMPRWIPDNKPTSKDLVSRHRYITIPFRL